MTDLTIKTKSTVYPDKNFTFNQHRAYIHLLSSKDLVSFNRYTVCLTRQERREVLQSINLKDLRSDIN